MAEQVALVTGGNRGLGFETARKLAARGYRVVLTARKVDEGEQAVAKIRAAHSTAQVQALSLDLGSLASVRTCAAAFGALGLPLHVLVNNAGRMETSSTPSFTADGFESTFGTNHVGPFLLTMLLLPLLERSAPARVVNVSSGMHRAGVGPGPGPDFDYENLRAEKSFEPTIAYRNSKLASVWFSRELARRTAGKGITVVAVSPGWVPETLAPGRPSAFQRFLFRYVLPRLPIARTLAQGSDNTVYAATEPSLVSQSGGFFEDLKSAPVSDDARDDARAKRLWDASLSWCGLPAASAAA